MTTTEHLKALQLAGMLWSMVMLGFKCSKVQHVLGLWKQQEALESSPFLKPRNAPHVPKAEAKTSHVRLIQERSFDSSNPGIELEQVDSSNVRSRNSVPLSYA